jgi:hypothetical protein
MLGRSQEGIGAVSEYMGKLIPKGSIKLNSPVKDIAADGTSVTVSWPVGREYDTS